MRLEGRTAIVTGAASGIGRAIACRFAEEGARVVVSDIRDEPVANIVYSGPEEAVSTTELIKKRGGDALFVKADVSRATDVDRLVKTGTELAGRLDVMVNNAAAFDAYSILDTSEEAWDALMAVSLRGTFLCCKQAIGQMLRQEEVREVRGRVINVSSQHGMVGPPEYVGYAAAKGGVVNLTRQLAVDYAKKGIIVNAVAPGRIITGTHPHEDDYSHPSLQYSLSRTPFPRLGRPEDVAGAALYLASDDCSFVSGINLLVDGGWMAY